MAKVREIEWSEPVPKCDACNGRNGCYDMPSIAGYWMNLCRNCLRFYASNQSLGTKKVPKKEGVK